MNFSYNYYGSRRKRIHWYQLSNICVILFAAIIVSANIWNIMTDQLALIVKVIITVIAVLAVTFRSMSKAGHTVYPIVDRVINACVIVATIGMWWLM